MKLDYDRGGAGPRLLVLLHGMGATREVWGPLVATIGTRWEGSWIAPDLRGHGRSAHANNYALGLHAADVAELVQGADDWSEIVVLGHSMGGVVALALASGWFGIVPSQVFGLGIKVSWTPEELAQLAKLAATPARSFETREAAIDRYLKVSGLTGLVSPDSPAASAGVGKGPDGWRLAADPATASIGAPPMRALLAAAKASTHLARGESDAMVAHDQLAAFDSAAVTLTGVGHNAMVQDPIAVWRWLEERRA
jgi:pimeloyl-ACP methyl ester carboxylesterase